MFNNAFENSPSQFTDKSHRITNNHVFDVNQSKIKCNHDSFAYGKWLRKPG